MPKIKEMDLKNKKILYELMINSRFSYSTIAKRVRLSPNAVKNRIRLMQKEKIIKKFCTGITRPNIGIHIQNLVLIKFKNIDNIKKQEIIEELKSIDRITQIMRFQGRWDLGLVLICVNIFELKNHINPIKNLMIDNIQDFEVNIINKQRLLQQFFFLESLEITPAKKYPNDGSLQADFPKKFIYDSSFKLTNLDLDILEIVANNCRLSFEEIAFKTKKDSQQIKYRMRRLVKNNIISKFFPVVDYKKMGYEKYMYFLKLKGTNLKKQKELFLYIKSNNFAFDYMVSINNWDLILTFYSKYGSHTFDEINSNILNNYGDIIYNSEILKILDEPKYESLQNNFSNFYKNELNDLINQRDFCQITD